MSSLNTSIRAQQWMRRALYLARLGEGSARPNPLVGCVIVCQGKIIGEGYHERYGAPHAEVNAVNSVADKSLIRDSEVYVSLEPCSHYGKTPPCADLLIKHKASKVFVCNLDPNPLVAGRGVERLRQAGASVETGLLEEGGRWINRRFFTQMEKKRPYILMKWAQTEDGFIARENYDSKWISNWLSRKMVHRVRTREAGILVGTNTALYDNPQLNARSWKGDNPTRLLLDLHERVPATHRLFDGSIPTVVYTYGESREKDGVAWRSVSEEAPLWPQILDDCQERELQSILVEGGSALLRSLIAEGLWDEARVFTGKARFGNGIPAPHIRGKRIGQRQVLDNALDIWIPAT